VKYGLIGEDLSHAYTKMIHQYLGCEYEFVELNQRELNEFMQKKDFEGINITYPYKTAVLPFCDVPSEYVNITKCANTIVNKNGMLYAYNSEISGFLYTLLYAGIQMEGRKVMILGQGAASRSIKLASEMNKAREIITVGRKSELNYENCYGQKDVNIIINATPVGQTPNRGEKLVELGRFSHLESVIDVIYNPFRTPLLLEAEKLGLKHICGLPMLTAKAKRSFEMFTDKKLDQDIIADIIERLRGEIMNIVLIGMPGSGKTKVGAALASKLKRKFYDTNQIIQNKLNMTPQQISNEKGENYLRNIEKKILYTLCEKKSCVISLGAGAVSSRTACETVKQNAFIVLIKRDAPISADDDKYAAAALYAERMFRYEKLADAVIKNDGALENTVNKVYEAFKAFRCVGQAK
jgi:shikimate dehydrogenase